MLLAQKKVSIKTLLLDLDGTLIDSRQDLVNSVNASLSMMGFPTQNFNDIVMRIGNGLRRLISETLLITDENRLLQAKKYFEDHYRDHCVDHTVLYPGVKDLLPLFSNRFPIGIVTNKPLEFAKKIVSTLGISPFIQTIVGGDSTEKAKPDPSPIREALSRLSNGDSSAMMVGDGIQDLLAGQSAGIFTCLAEYGFGFRKELLDKKPTFSIKDFSELKEILI